MSAAGDLVNHIGNRVFDGVDVLRQRVMQRGPAQQVALGSNRGEALEQHGRDGTVESGGSRKAVVSSRVV